METVLIFFQPYIAIGGEQVFCCFTYKISYLLKLRKVAFGAQEFFVPDRKGHIPRVKVHAEFIKNSCAVQQIKVSLQFLNEHFKKEFSDCLFFYTNYTDLTVFQPFDFQVYQTPLFNVGMILNSVRIMHSLLPGAL